MLTAEGCRQRRLRFWQQLDPPNLFEIRGVIRIGNRICRRRPEPADGRHEPGNSIRRLLFVGQLILRAGRANNRVATGNHGSVNRARIARTFGVRG